MAQPISNPSVQFVASDPSGACSNNGPMRYNYTNNTYFGCNNGTWATVTGGGSGTVTSVATGNCLTGGTFTTSGTVALGTVVLPKIATYQVVAADFSLCKTITVASGTFTITLVASGSQPANGTYTDYANYGSGSVTIARSGQNINGGTDSIVLGPGTAIAPTSARVTSDGTNYFATVNRGMGGNCPTASSLGFKLDGTDEGTLWNSTWAAYYTAGTGGCIYIDCGKTLRSDSFTQFGGTTPATVAPGSAPPYRITGCNSSASGWNGVAVPAGGSTLDLRYKGSGLTQFGGGPKLFATGVGRFELDHFTLTTGAASDCALFVMTTGAIPAIHDVTFSGTGCNGGYVAGGTGTYIGTYPANTPLSTAITGPFGGYGGYVSNNYFYGFGNATQPVILLQSNVNAFNIGWNWYGLGGSSTAYRLNGGQSFAASAGPIIYSNGYSTGTNSNRSNVIDGGVFEFFNDAGIWHTYTCAIKIHNTEELTVMNAQVYDGDSSTAAFCGDSTGIKSRIDKSNYFDVAGGLYVDATWSANNSMPYRSINFQFDGGGSALSGTTTRCSQKIPFGGVINQFAMYADQSGNASIAVTSGSSPASQSAISGSGETITGAASLVDTTLSGWTYAGLNPAAGWLAPGSVVCVTLSSPATITWLTGGIQILEGR